MQIKRIWQSRPNQASTGSRVRTARGYAEGGDLAAAGGDVGQAGGAEAGEEAAEFSAEQIGREVHQHVAKLDGLDRRDVRENFPADGDAFLDDPNAAGRCGVDGIDGGDRAADGFVPIFFVGFPTESDPASSVFIAGFEHKVFAIFANELQQLDVFAVVRGAGIGNDASPRNVAANDFAFLVGK